MSSLIDVAVATVVVAMNVVCVVRSSPSQTMGTTRTTFVGFSRATLQQPTSFVYIKVVELARRTTTRARSMCRSRAFVLTLLALRA